MVNVPQLVPIRTRYVLAGSRVIDGLLRCGVGFGAGRATVAQVWGGPGGVVAAASVRAGVEWVSVDVVGVVEPHPATARQAPRTSRRRTAARIMRAWSSLRRSAPMT